MSLLFENLRRCPTGNNLTALIAAYVDEHIHDFVEVEP